MTYRTTAPLALAALVLAPAALAQSAALPFTETFADSGENFLNTGFAPLEFIPGTDADGSGFVRNAVPSDAAGDMGLVVARIEFNAFDPTASASGGAFIGDFITGDISTFSFDVRHDADAPIDITARFSPPTRFPGAFPLVPQSVAPSEDFTTLTFDLSFASLGFEGAPTPALFDQIFSNVGNIQIFLGTDLSTVSSGTVNFDFDNVAIAVPEPTTLVMAGLGGLAFCQRRRRA